MKNDRNILEGNISDLIIYQSIALTTFEIYKKLKSDNRIPEDIKKEYLDIFNQRRDKAYKVISSNSDNEKIMFLTRLENELKNFK